MVNGGMDRRLQALEAQVTGATQTEEQREAAGREAEATFWRKMIDLGKRLQGMDAPTAERLNGESVASLVARLVVPGPVAEDLVKEALRTRLVWMDERGEGDGDTAALVRWILELAEAPEDSPIALAIRAAARAHEETAEGEDPRE